MATLKNIWRLSKGGRTVYLFTILCVILSTIFSYAIPVVLQFSIDTVIGGKPIRSFAIFFEDFQQFLVDKNALAVCAMLIISFAFIQGVFSFFKGRYAAHAGENIARNLRNTLFWNRIRVPFSHYGRINSGDVIQRCSSDVETIRLFIQTQSVEFFRVLVMILLVLPIMFHYDVKMALSSTCLLPIIVIYSWRYFFKMKDLHRAVSVSEAKLSTVVQENLTGARVVKAFARQRFEIDKFEERNSDLRDMTFNQLDEVSKYWAISASFCMSQIGVVLIYGVYAAANGVIEVGTLHMFLAFEVILVWTIRGLGRIIGEMGRAMVSFSRIGELLDDDVEDGIIAGETRVVTGEIEFKDVSFSYDKTRVLKNISLKIPRGKTVAIIGPTGSGKSSLVNLLPRLYDCESGEILIDGIPIDQFQLNHLRKSIGLVLQEPFLFSDTIAENIRSGADSELPDDELLRVAKIAEVHDVIESFESGYDTFVGERGVTLSGGQKQRVAIARALAQPHPILIFDDSLSAVDSDTDFRIRKNLADFCSEVTTIIVSHRMSTVSSADIIYVLENGEITAHGDHEGLLKAGGLYSRLWDIQQEMSVDE